MPIPPALDSFDRKILQQLTANGRTTWSDLAEIVGLSLTPTIRRVRQLEEAGYTPAISPGWMRRCWPGP